MAKGMQIANRATTGSKLSNKSTGSIGDKLTNIADRSMKGNSGKSPASFGKIGSNTTKAVTTKGLGNKTPMGPKGLKGK